MTVTVVRRVVVNAIDDLLHTIEGDPNTSFREACVGIAPVDIEWVVLDAEGKDISDLTLKAYKGMAQILSYSIYEKFESSLGSK